MKCTCRRCGDKFTVDSETAELVNEGYAERPTECNECSYDEQGEEFDTFSDADSGL